MWGHMRTGNTHHLILSCTDFGVGTCCSGCHQNDALITVYPYSHISDGKVDKLADISLGIIGEVCCGRYETVRMLPRAWWLERYGKWKGWSESDIAKFQLAKPAEFYKVWGEISERYYRRDNPHVGSSVGSHARVVASPRGKAQVRKCPSCGAGSFFGSCDGCGYGHTI